MGLSLCLAFGASELCSAGEAADAIQVGSTWRDNAGHTLTILERNGETYRGRFTKNDQFIRDVTGSIEGNKISWLARDVTPIKGGPGGDNFGTITGDKIDFKFTGNHGRIARASFTLTRVSGGNGSRAVGPSGIDPATLGGLIKANRGNLVVLKGENGAGSGFIAKVGNVNLRGRFLWEQQE